MPILHLSEKKTLEEIASQAYDSVPVIADIDHSLWAVRFDGSWVEKVSEKNLLIVSAKQSLGIAISAEEEALHKSILQDPEWAISQDEKLVMIARLARQLISSKSDDSTRDKKKKSLSKQVIVLFNTKANIFESVIAS